ncbi:MAG: DUF4179 domain-containing protein [Waltera sp.]
MRNYQRKIGKEKRQSRKRKFVQTGAAAAAIVVAIGFCAANPVLAKELPLIGSVIERVQELLGVPGDSDRRNCNVWYQQGKENTMPGREKRSGTTIPEPLGSRVRKPVWKLQNRRSIRYRIRATPLP